MSFIKYQHLERFGNVPVEGIELGTVYVFPKLDGTNASIWVDEDGNYKTGSRNRQLSIESDNAGFHNWVLKNQNKFEKFFLNHPNLRLYGEWLVPHSLKTYNEDSWRNFYIFDVMDKEENYLHYDDYKLILDCYGLTYIPPIMKINNGTIEHFQKCLERNTYLIKEGCGFGEGVVLKNYNWKNKFGQVIWAKLITNSFKEQHMMEMGCPVIGHISNEERIVNEFVTDHFVRKTYDKIRVAEDGWKSQYIPRLLNTVFYDLITEEMWEILKKYKNPTLNFKFLQNLTIKKVKELLPEVF